MPEGHTIHRLARELDDAFGGRVVAASSPQGRFARGAAIVDGTVLETAEAHGKHLFVRFAGERWIHVHLGLFGIFVVVPAPPPDSVVGEVRLRLAADTAYADLRGPTACDLVTPQERATLYARLGPDPLRGDDPSAALARLGRSRTAIGTALLDQAVFAGVGNVYRAEVLFRAGIDPATESRRLGSGVLAGLWSDLAELMRRGVETGRIDTVRPEHEPEAMGRPPRVDDHGGEVYVYRRAGRPCLVCGTPVATREVAARNLFWCPVCQR